MYINNEAASQNGRSFISTERAWAYDTILKSISKYNKDSFYDLFHLP